MSVREPQRTRPRPRRRIPAPAPRKTAPARRVSGIAGGVLLALGVIWMGYLLVHQFGGPTLPGIPVLNFGPTPLPTIQSSPLSALGITLTQSNQTPTINKQQVLLIANQLEADAAAHAKSTTAQFVVLNYQNKVTPATHPVFNNVPVWMVVYQKIPLQPPDSSVDPTAQKRTSYDLYVFLDASSGKELLKIQV